VQADHESSLQVAWVPAAGAGRRNGHAAGERLTS